MRRAVRQFGEKKVLPSQVAPTINLEGYPAWDKPLPEAYLQMLLTNTFGSTYYVEKDALTQESEKLNTQILSDPQNIPFIARALVYAREEGYMRTQPIYGLARLMTTSCDEAGRVWGERAFSRVIKTPNDLMDFMTIVRSLRGGEGGGRIKRVVGQWLDTRLTPFYAVKYGATNGAGGYSLRDIVRTVHPPSTHPDSAQAYAYLLARSAKFDDETGQLWVYRQRRVNGTSVDTGDILTHPVLVAVEKLRRATSATEKARWISEGLLPHEVSTTCAGKDPVVWKAIVLKMPIFALLRHLATIERLGLDRDADVMQHIIQTFASERKIAESRIFPFQFAKALEQVKNPALCDALYLAVDYALGRGVESLPPRTGVLLDVSASMEGDYLQQGALFAYGILRKSPQAVFYTFSGEAYRKTYSRAVPALHQARDVQSIGPTNTSAPLLDLMKRKESLDSIVLITDGQQNDGIPLCDAYDQYLRTVHPHTRMFIISPAPYRAGYLPVSKENLRVEATYLYGLSDTLLTLLGFVMRGWGTMVDAVNRVDLGEMG